MHPSQFHFDFQTPFPYKNDKIACVVFVVNFLFPQLVLVGFVCGLILGYDDYDYYSTDIMTQ